MRARTAGTFLAVVAVLVIAVAACSGGDQGSSGGGGGGSSSASGGGGSTAQVTIKDFAFDPNSLSGAADQTLTITLTNEDSAEHSFTLDDGSLSKDIEAGDSVTVDVPLPASGTVAWHCKYHQSMTGTITIG